MSRPTQTLTGKKAREAVLRGVNAVYKPVASTLGPQGKSVLLFRTFGRGPRITDDGYTVAECQIPKDPFVALAAGSFKEICMRTNEKVGDGTTTTAVIGGKLFNDTFDLISKSSSEILGNKHGVMTIRQTILEAGKKVKAEILKVAKKTKTLEELEKIAVISCKDEVLGKVVAKMAHEVGIDGFIDVVEGFKHEIETEVNKGMRFAAKPAAKAFITNVAKFEMTVADCDILITNYALDNIADAARPLSNFNKSIGKIIVVAPSFGDNVLVEFTKSFKGGYLIYPVAVPSLRTEQLEDLATYCGATFFDKAKGKNYQNAQLTDLGFVEKIIVKDQDVREDAVILGGEGTKDEAVTYYEDEEVETEEHGKKVKKKKKVMKEKMISKIALRIEELKGQHKEIREDRFKKLMERRIASMASSVGIIRVGDSTSASALFQKLKIEDAVYACKAALRGGYVKGGGLCLKEIADKLPADNLLKAALLEPYTMIQASFEGGTEIGDDIIDPAEAVYYAVEHATNAVANLITVETITVEDFDTQPGDGYIAIAKAVQEMVISKKLELGQIKENEEEMERDRMNGLTSDEIVTLDRG